MRTAGFIFLSYISEVYTAIQIYHKLFTTFIYKFRKFMRFLRFECQCTIFRQTWANKDKKLVFLSKDKIYV